jgi:hypothetical protein
LYFFQQTNKKIALSREMNPSFIDYVRTMPENLLLSTESISKRSYIEIMVLDMFIDFFQTNPDDLKSNNMLTISIHYIKKLLIKPVQLLKWILMHPTLSMAFVFCVKIVKIAFCLYTTLDDITPLIEAVKQFFDHQPLAVAMLETAKTLYQCFVSYSGKVECIKQTTFGLGSLLLTSVKWVLNFSNRIFNNFLRSLTSRNNDELRSFQTLSQILMSPTALFTYMFYGEQKTLDVKAVLGQLIYHCNGDFDSIALSFILKVFPAMFLPKLFGFLTRMASFYWDPKGSLLKALKEYDATILALVNKFVPKNSTKFVSALDIIHMSLEIGTNILSLYLVWDMITSVFEEVIPCFFQTIKRYITFSPKSNIPCCMTVIVNDIKFVLKNNYKPGGFIRDLFGQIGGGNDGTKKKKSQKKKKQKTTSVALVPRNVYSCNISPMSR